jgi:hypothetical protein
LNHATYKAGRKNSVRKVAAFRPPITATAIGPQKIEREHVISANATAATVRLSLGSEILRAQIGKTLHILLRQAGFGLGGAGSVSGPARNITNLDCGEIISISGSSLIFKTPAPYLFLV